MPQSGLETSRVHVDGSVGWGLRGCAGKWLVGVSLAVCGVGYCSWSLYLSPGSNSLRFGGKQSPAESDGLVACCETLQRKQLGSDGKLPLSDHCYVNQPELFIPAENERGCLG